MLALTRVIIWIKVVFHLPDGLGLGLLQSPSDPPCIAHGGNLAPPDIPNTPIPLSP